MHALVLAKRRAALRRGDEGAVMFVVAMTIAVLASVGVYALAAAATEVRMSGNERQNTQTHYLASYGIQGAARQIAGSVGDTVIPAMEAPPGPTGRDIDCVSLQGVPPVPNTAAALACKRYGRPELSTLNPQWSPNTSTPSLTAYGNNAPYAPSTPPGSFGKTPMDADFFVEVTEPETQSTTAHPGMSQNSGTCFVQVTATSVGYTRPLFPGAATTAKFGGEGVEMQRARLIVGPVTRPCGKAN